MDCSPPGSSVHGIIQARILEWSAIAFSRGSSLTRYWTRVSCFAARFFTIWATREALRFKGKKQILKYSPCCSWDKFHTYELPFGNLSLLQSSIHSFILIFINSTHINWKLLHEWIKKKYNVLMSFLVNFYITLLIQLNVNKIQSVKNLWKAWTSSYRIIKKNKKKKLREKKICPHLKFGNNHQEI